MKMNKLQWITMIAMITVVYSSAVLGNAPSGAAFHDVLYADTILGNMQNKVTFGDPLYVGTLCLNNDCKSSWPVGGSSIATPTGKLKLTGTTTGAFSELLTLIRPDETSGGTAFGNTAAGALRIGTSSGSRLSIGTTVDGNDKRIVYDSYFGFSHMFDHQGQEIMRMTPDLKVGIGVTAPQQKLEVAGNIKATGVCIGGDCRTAWPSGGSGSSCTVRTNTLRSLSVCGASVSCQAGETAMSGGCENSGCSVTINKPNVMTGPATGWVCGGWQDSSYRTGVGFTINAYAICCR